MTGHDEIEPFHGWPGVTTESGALDAPPGGAGLHPARVRPAVRRPRGGERRGHRRPLGDQASRPGLADRLRRDLREAALTRSRPATFGIRETAVRGAATL